VLELAARWQARRGQDVVFERTFDQLRPFYSDFAHRLPPSTDCALIHGLYLVHLLVQNRLPDFHTTLESLPDSLANSPHVEYAVDLEQKLAEGSYHRILTDPKSKHSNALPDPLYASMLKQLAMTMREEMAASIEQAYTHLGVAEIAAILGIQGGSKALVKVDKLAKERGWHLPPRDQVVEFGKHQVGTDGVAMTTGIPTHEILASTLSICQRIDAIV